MQEETPRHDIKLVAVTSTGALGSPGVAGDRPSSGPPHPIGRLLRTGQAAFQVAARDFDVPRDLLVSIAYGETHLDGHGGRPSADGGYGVMHLVDNPQTDTLGRAARLTGLREAVLRRDSAQNVRGGAAVLRALADRLGLDAADRDDLDAWYSAVARYSNAADDRVARLYADTVYRLLASGLRARTPQGEVVAVPRHDVAPRRGAYASVPSPDAPTDSTDYPGASWVPAYAGNYSNYSRTAEDIDYVVIHTTQGSYAGAISWFQSSASNVSAHYVIRSSDGQITQLVRDEDVAWHAGNRTYNEQSIGVEHEGWVDQPSWYTDAMYRSSAALVRAVCDADGIPKDCEHILGHSEVPGATHTDPVPNWDWDYYLRLVNGPSKTWRTVVDNSDVERFSASESWGVSSWNPDHYGPDDRYARSSRRVRDRAWFRIGIPATDDYSVYVRYPASSGYSARSRFFVATEDRLRVFTVDQQVNGGRWVELGTFRLAGGDREVVGLSRRNRGGGYVTADGVRLVRR